MLHSLKYIKQHKWSICVQLDTIKRDHIATIGWVEGGEWGRKNIPKLRKDKDVEKKEEWVKTSIHNNEFFSTYGIFILFFFKVLSVFGGKTLYDKKSKLEDKMVEV